MPIMRAMHAIQMVSGVPEDRAINTWHFDVSVVSDANLQAITNALGAFYSGLNSNWSPAVATTGHTVTWYNLADPEPRVPVATQTYATPLGVGATALPAEVCCTLSFQAIPSSGTPQARRRGRVFLGPFATTVMGGGVAAQRMSSAFTGAVATAASALLAASDAATNWTWVVRSEAGGFVVNVDNGWVDNAFDTQRRRGVESTVRSTWT